MIGKTKILLLCCLVFAVVFSNAQSNSEGIMHLFFKRHNSLLFPKNIKKHKRCLMRLLVIKPENLDAKILLAKTYSWNNQFDKARNTFNKLLTKNKNVEELWVAAINNERFANNNYTALGLTNKALKYITSDTLQDLKVSITTSLNQVNNHMSETKPSNKDALAVSGTVQVFDKGI